MEGVVPGVRLFIFYFYFSYLSFFYVCVYYPCFHMFNGIERPGSGLSRIGERGGGWQLEFLS